MHLSFQVTITVKLKGDISLPLWSMTNLLNRLSLWIDEQWPPFGLLYNQGILCRVIILWQSLVLPF